MNIALLLLSFTVCHEAVLYLTPEALLAPGNMPIKIVKDISVILSNKLTKPDHLGSKCITLKCR